jgi:TatD DNase family protein
VARPFAGRPIGVLHYYSSDVETAQRYAALGFLISIHTSVTHPRASALRDGVAAMPLDSLVIETDAPYGAPQSRRGKRNEPSLVVEAARQIAELKGISIEEVATATTANARRLFGFSAVDVRTAVAGAKS